MAVSVALFNLHDGHVDGYVRRDLDVMSLVFFMTLNIAISNIYVLSISMMS